MLACELLPPGVENFVLYCRDLPYKSITMSSKASQSEILTIKQVADYLKVTERTIYRLAAIKKIPAFKVGGAWRFSRSDISDWIKKQSLDEAELISKEHAADKSQSKAGERK
jgi:excisionase family DNA binding protein